MIKGLFRWGFRLFFAIVVLITLFMGAQVNHWANTPIPTPEDKLENYDTSDPPPILNHGVCPPQAYC